MIKQELRRFLLVAQIYAMNVVICNVPANFTIAQNIQCSGPK